MWMYLYCKRSTVVIMFLFVNAEVTNLDFLSLVKFVHLLHISEIISFPERSPNCKKNRYFLTKNISGGKPHRVPIKGYSHLMLTARLCRRKYRVFCVSANGPHSIQKGPHSIKNSYPTENQR